MIRRYDAVQERMWSVDAVEALVCAGNWVSQGIIANLWSCTAELREVGLDIPDVMLDAAVSTGSASDK